MLPVKTIIGYFWAAMSVVWIIGAITAKRTARTQPRASRVLHLSLAALAFVIGFTKTFAFGPLVRPFVPDSAIVRCTGLLLTFVGISVAVWARLFLGGNWSSAITIKQNHTLVRNGPYAFVRHPIYSGVLVAVLGTAIAFGELRGLVATGLVFILLFLRARMEETFMIGEFGSDYKEYSRKVRALIPFLY